MSSTTRSVDGSERSASTARRNSLGHLTTACSSQGAAVQWWPGWHNPPSCRRIPRPRRALQLMRGVRWHPHPSDRMADTHTARIIWSENQQRIGLPQGFEYVHPARFSSEPPPWPDGAWSLVCQFDSPHIAREVRRWLASGSWFQRHRTSALLQVLLSGSSSPHREWLALRCLIRCHDIYRAI